MSLGNLPIYSRRRNKPGIPRPDNQRHALPIAKKVNVMFEKTGRVRGGGGRRRWSGLTILEVMISAAIVLLVVLGTAGVRYHTVINARKAEMQLRAARLGSTLCESWRGVDGSKGFNPVVATAPVAKLTSVSQGPATDAAYTVLGHYYHKDDNVNYYLTLAWQDVSSGLRLLNVQIAWNQRDEGVAAFTDVNKTLSLTTYASY